MLYKKGLGKIFDTKFIEEQKKKDPAFFSREYEGRYGYGLGNVFLHDEIENWFDKPSYEAIINLVSTLKVRCRPGKIYVDGAKPDFIKSLKSMFNEPINYDKIIERARKDKVDYEARMFVVPVSFSEWGKELLGRFQHVVSKRWFSISRERT